MYRLTRDDGKSLFLDGGSWEGALELAFFYGWRPAGTEAPRRADGAAPRPEPQARPWDGHDYFSHHRQRVGSDDARALAGALLRALLHIPDSKARTEDTSAQSSSGAASTIPSRASAVADGLSSPRRNAIRRFAVFADRGGFTIGGSP